MPDVIDTPAIEVPAEPAPAVESTPAEAQPRPLQDRIESLRGKARDAYRLNGDVDAAERMMKKSDVKPAPSTGDAVGDSPGNEPDSATGDRQLGKRPRQSPNGAERNFEELRKAKERLEIENDILRKQIAVPATAPTKTPAPKDVTTPPPLTAEPARPRMKDFNDPDAYDDAVTKYEKDVKTWDRQDAARVRAEEGQRSESRRIADSYQRQNQEAIKKYPDFQAVAFSDKLPLSHAAVHLIPRLENGAELQYWLGKNPAEAARIATLTDIQGLDPADPQGHFEKLLRENHPVAHQVLGMLRAEFARIPKAAPAAAVPSKPPLREVFATHTRPSSEVDIEGGASAAPIADPIAAARKSGNWALANRLQNEKEIRERKSGVR